MWQGCGQTGSLYTAGGNIEQCCCCQKTFVGVSQKVKHVV